MPDSLENHAITITEKLRELSAAIDDAIRAVAERKEQALTELEPWLTKKQAAQHLAMSVSTLEGRLAGRMPPPHTNDGGRLRFKATDLDAWMRQWTVHYRRRKLDL